MTTNDPAVPSREDAAGTELGDWTGLVRFAGVMLLVLGLFQFTEGLTALYHDRAYLVTGDGTLIEPNYVVWGWSHVILGLISIAAGAGVLRGLMWARVVGALFACGAAVIHFLMLAVSPLWSTILICVEIVVVYALLAHGGQVRRRR